MASYQFIYHMQGLNKTYGTALLASEAVQIAAGPGFAWRRLDRVAVVGRHQGTLVFELAKLAEAPRAAVVVEDRYGNLLKHAYATAGFLPDILARVQVRYPEIAIVFLETRPLAEEWTFRYLGAALAEYESEQHGAAQIRAAELPLDYQAVGPEPSRGRPKPGA